MSNGQPGPGRWREVNDRQVSAQRVIEAPAPEIFAVLRDPALHPVIDGSGSVRSSRGTGARLELGSRFSMSMKLGLPYLIANTVIEYEPDRLIAWRHWHHHCWRYTLEPLPQLDGSPRTEVTETFDWSRARSPYAIEVLGFPRKHPAAMERTLERLDRLVTTGTVEPPDE